MIMSTDAQKAFDKIQHPPMIEILSKLGIERSFVNLIKITKKLTYLMLNVKLSHLHKLQSKDVPSHHSFPKSGSLS